MTPQLYIAKSGARHAPTLPLDAVTRTFAILGQRGTGKRLALDTPLPTPSGWTTMGAVREGDMLFDEVGQPCRVTHVSPVQVGDSYRVRFKDGASLIADAEHLWLTWDKPSRRAVACRAVKARRRVLAGGDIEGRHWPKPRALPAVRSTAEIRDTLRYLGELNHTVPNAQPLDLPERDLPVDPYVLGVWLGDGTSACAHITTADPEILGYIGAAGFEMREVPSLRQPGCRTYCVLGLRSALRELGLLRNKHIPGEYLRASYGQRLALLRGLMDTDGNWGHGPQVEIALSDERLAADVYELIVSLGWRASRARRETTGRDSFRSAFSPTAQPFRLNRKAARFNAGARRNWPHRAITSVEKVKDVPMRCIAVDAVSHLYLAGEAMIPTHNTNTAVVLAEEMARKGGHVAVLDPVGAWYGITRRGEKKGIPGIVLGGEHGDVPLEETGGQLVAELVVGRHWPIVVIDMKLMRKGAQLRFMADYLEALFQMNREPLCQVFEEADRPLPQQGRNFDVTAGRVLGAGEDIVKLGRSRGLGAVLVTQRPATLNKNALEVCETLLLHRLMGPNDRKAVKGWVEANGDPDVLKAVMDTMSSLKLGEAWLYSPGWLGNSLPDLRLANLGARKATGLARLRMRERHTFDSSFTPEVGQQVGEPGERAPVDIEALRNRMAETIEHAKANDPRELRRRITELEKQLSTSESREPEVETRESEVEVLVPDPAAIGEMADIAGDLRIATEAAERVVAGVRGTVEELDDLTRRAQTTGDAIERALMNARQLPERQRVQEPSGARESPARAPAGRLPAAPRRAEFPSGSTGNGTGPSGLGKAPRTLLETLVSVYPRRLSKAELSTLSGYKPRSSTYRNALSALRTAGLLDEAGGTFAPTQGALETVEPPEPKSASEIRAMWRGTFGNSAPGAMLEVLIADYPNAVDREELAERSRYSLTSSTYRNALSALRRNGLMEDTPSGGVRAADALFSDAIPV